MFPPYWLFQWSLISTTCRPAYSATTTWTSAAAASWAGWVIASNRSLWTSWRLAITVGVGIASWLVIIAVVINVGVIRPVRIVIPAVIITRVIIACIGWLPVCAVAIRIKIPIHRQVAVAVSPVAIAVRTESSRTADGYRRLWVIISSAITRVVVVRIR